MKWNTIEKEVERIIPKLPFLAKNISNGKARDLVVLFDKEHSGTVLGPNGYGAYDFGHYSDKWTSCYGSEWIAIPNNIVIELNNSI